jgi:hypothetical protein
MFIHDSIGSPYIGCLPLQYLLSNPGVVLSNSGVVERSTLSCTSRPTAGRYGQIGQRSREPSPDSRSRTTPKWSGVQASNMCGAEDVFGYLNVYSRCNSSLLGTATQRRTRTCWGCQLDPFFRGKCSTSLICMCFSVMLAAAKYSHTTVWIAFF